MAVDIALAPQFITERGELILRARDEQDILATRGEFAREDLADAGRSACDERVFIFTNSRFESCLKSSHQYLFCK